jgi:hypothetical protein
MSLPIEYRALSSARPRSVYHPTCERIQRESESGFGAFAVEVGDRYAQMAAGLQILKAAS